MMNSGIFVQVSELPDQVRAALESVGYHRADVAIEPAERVSMLVTGGAGQRGFVVLLDLATGRTQRHDGSWGGANVFNQDNPVDLDQSEHVLPEGGAVLKGSTGAHTYCTVFVHPRNLVPLLPAKVELDKKQQHILYAYGAIKPGTYRRAELESCGATDQDIDLLIGMKLLKRDGRGVSITTAGKNARR